jgi:uncharacterized protein YbjT (DUF2867 family)
MKIAVTTPTGNIGRRLTPKLLGEGADVVLLTRSPEKVKDFVDRGARVESGDLSDGAFVQRATAGTDTLFWLTPPSYETDDLRAFQKELGGVAAAAVRANGIPRVVYLSSVGAQLDAGTGPILGLRYGEKMLNDTPAQLTHLRPTYFMENYLHSLDTIKEAGSVFLPIRGSVRMPMIATQDIAEAAAKRILDPEWGAKETVMTLLGPEDVTFDEAARILSEGLGKTVKHITVTPEQAREAMAQTGLKAKTVDLFLEMYDWMDQRMDAGEPRTPETTTPTTLASFTREVLKPLVG